MDGRLIELKAWGCNIDEVMERFLDDEEFYFECYAQAMEDPCFSQLKEALEKHDIKRGFESAHTLKGLIANLGLISLLHIISEIVEPLRAGTDEGLLDKYQELLKERDRYAKMVKKKKGVLYFLKPEKRQRIAENS